MALEPQTWEWQDLPLILLSELSPSWANEINVFSRTRQAEVQWVGDYPVAPMVDRFDTFDVCEGFLECLDRNPNRRMVWMGNYQRDHPALNRALSSKLLLWISCTHDIDSCRTFVEFFLEGKLSEEAILEHNQKAMRTSLANLRDWDPSEVQLLDFLIGKTTSVVWQMPPVPTHRPELPLILLDIDGCLLFPLRNKNKQHNPTVIHKVKQWSRSRKAEIRWMTYWGHTAVTKFAPSMALDTFEHGRDVVANTKKEIQLLHWIDRNPNRKIIWIDDKIQMYLTQWMDDHPDNHSKVQRVLHHSQLLMVQPNDTIGVSKDELELVDAFLAGHTTVTSLLEHNNRIMAACPLDVTPTTITVEALTPSEA